MIELQQLCRRFEIGDQVVKALDEVNLSIDPGEYLSVMGPSGSGKSTLLNILGLLDRADSGSYRLDGTRVDGLNEAQLAAFRQQKIGFVFQSYHLIPRLTARENMELPMTLAGFEPRKRHARVDELLDRLQLTERADHLPNQLSGGQRQRVAIGRAIAMQPELILADEPTGNLDSQSGQTVIELLEELNRDGITLLLVTHDPNMGQRAKRQLRMLDGRIDSDQRRS